MGFGARRGAARWLSHWREEQEPEAPATGWLSLGQPGGDLIFHVLIERIVAEAEDLAVGDAKHAGFTTQGERAERQWRGAILIGTIERIVRRKRQGGVGEREKIVRPCEVEFALAAFVMPVFHLIYLYGSISAFTPAQWARSSPEMAAMHTVRHHRVCGGQEDVCGQRDKCHFI